MINKFKKKLGKDAHLKELLTGSAVTFVIKITGMLIGYLVVLLISRKYGAEGVGLYGLTSKLLNSLAILGCLGMNISVLRYVGQFAKNANAPAWLKQLYGHITAFAFPFSVVVGIGLYFSAEIIALQLFENTTYIPALKISAFALPFFTINLINVEFIRGLKLLRVSEYLRSINRQLVIIVLLGLSVFSYGILDSVYALVVGLLLTFVFSMGFIIRYFKKNKAKPILEKGLTKKELLGTSMPMMTTAVASFVLANVGAVFLEIYSTTDQVGIFNVALRLAQLVSLVLVVVNTISGPKFAELYWAGKLKELKRVIRQSSKLIFWVSLVISGILILFSNFFLNFFGEEFRTGSMALIILIFGQMINAMAGSVGIFLNMSGNQKMLRNFIVLTSIIVLAGNFVLIPIYGIIGVAIATSIGSLIINLTCVIFIYRKMKIKTFYLPFLKFKS
ncbi:MAG TPA: flippase [Flavobacteriaceae bacterium]|nr:flippase [Flavobacteriaceae bacterium]